MNIGFIGVGNMGSAILKGYAPVAETAGDVLFVFDPKKDICSQLEKDFGAVKTCETMEELISQSELVFLGVKPNLFAKLLPQLSPHVTPDKTLISMAAGIPLELMQNHLGLEAKIVRIMPNLPAQVKESMVAVCPNENVDEKTRRALMKIFQTLGKAELIDEALIHCVIGVSGSSPAYTYMYIDALIQAAIANGMDPVYAKTFAAQSVLGAAKMVLETSLTPEQLWTNVCSVGGTTIEAVNYLKNSDFTDIIKEAFAAVVEKSKELEKHDF